MKYPVGMRNNGANPMVYHDVLWGHHRCGKRGKPLEDQPTKQGS